MKPKSPKLRFLVTLYAIFKHTDEDHRLNSVKLNEYLKPYGLECTGRVIGDSVAVLREFGLDVRSKGEWDNQGIWLKDRPITDEQLNALIFAVTTNPFISEEEATEILSSLTPLVTVYQEPLLKSCVTTVQDCPIDSELFNKYKVICEAISSKRRIYYRTYYLKYDKPTESIYMTAQWPTLFTPKCIHQVNNRLYMVGYNNTDKMISAVEIQSIAEIKIAFKHKDPLGDEVQKILETINPQECVEQMRGPLIYKGKVTFKCRAPYLDYLYRIFGEPEGSVIKDVRGRCTYTVPEAEIWAKTLFDLSYISRNYIRIEGPKELTEAIRNYSKETVDTLLNPVLPSALKK